MLSFVIATEAAMHAIICDSNGGSAVGQVLIRNIPEGLIEIYKVKARLQGSSLEHELRAILKQAAAPTAEERLAAVERVAALQKKPSKLLSEDVIRRIRNRRV